MLLNRKLIIAVLTIGLMLSFSSAAIGYDDTKLIPNGPIQSLSKNPTIDAVTLETIRHIPDFQKSAPLTPITGQFDGIMQERLYEHLQYNDGLAWFWSIPDEYNDTKFATRMTMTADGILRSAYVPVAQNDGVVDLRISIYGDFGGYPDPTDIIATWVVPNASLPAVGFWGYRGVEIDAGNAGGATYPDDFEFAAGDEFHIVAEVDGGGEYGVSTLNFVTDNATAPEVRSSEDWNGFWGFMLDDWGANYTFAMWSEVEYDAGPLTGDCVWYSYDCGAAYFWMLDATAGNMETHYGVRFTAAQPETLKVVDIAFYDVVDNLGNSIWGSYYPGLPPGDLPVGRVDICEPGPTGPNITTPLHTMLFNDFEMDWWTSVDMINDEGVTLIMEGDYYIVVSIDGVTCNADYDGLEGIAILSDDGSCPTGRSGLYADVVPGIWLAYSGGYNWLMNVNACADTYSTCFWNWGPYVGYAYFWRIPGFFDFEETMYVTGAGVRFDPAQAGCDLGEIDIWFYGGNMAEDAEMAIYSDAGGLPGTRLQYEPITGGSWPSGNFPLIQSLFFDTPIWVVVESFSATDDDIQFITDDGSGPSNRCAMLNNGAWELFGPYNWVMDVYQCCYPFIVRTCAPDGDWPTMGKDYARTQSTLNEVGDIQCNLKKAWTYVNTSGQGCTFAQPIIAEGYVYAYMFDCLVAVDVNTGIELWRRDLNYVEIGGSCRATPTYHDGAIYCGGGDNGYFAKYDALTGATIWLFAMNGHAQYSPNLIMDVGGTELVFVADGLGNIYGLQTSDGGNFYNPGTGTPAFTVSGQVHKGLATDGTYLYVGCDEYLTTPDVFRLAVSPTAVTEDWKLTDGIGWQLQNVVAANGWRPESSQEGIYDAILYSDEGADGEWIYFVGRYQPQNSSPVHNGGLIYRVKADGTELGWVSECNGGGSSAGSGIINDKAQVIYGGWSYWIEGGQYYGPMAFSKSTGLPQWGPRDYEPNWGIQEIPDPFGHCSQPGVLTCESIADPSENDWLIFGNEFGYWNFADATVGEVIWSRRSARFLTYVTGPVVDGAGHIILGEQWNLHCLANDAPRPRLHIADMHPELPVPFGLPPSYDIVFGGLLVNTGCADLEIFHVELLDQDNGTFPNNVRTVNNDLAENVSAIAKENTGLKARAATFINERGASVGFSKTTMTPAAFALPDYITAVVEPADGTIIPAGGSVDIVINIDGTKVPRGASMFYAEIHSDDPDYFLDSAYMDYGVDAADPTVLLTIVGGCLYNSMQFDFGDGGGNHIPIWNSGHIMASNAGNFEIDGNSANLYGADGLCYSIDTERVVMHWLDGFGDPMWESLLPDPLPTCDFAVENDVLLAQMSDDGTAYSNVLGQMVNYAYVDSMEDHRYYEIDDITGDTIAIHWLWDLEYQTGLNKPYAQDLTEGWAFKALVTEYAVTEVTGPKYGFEDFWQFTISRHAVYSRYGTAIPGLYVGMIADWDVADYGENITGYSEEFSVGWIFDPTSMPADDYGGGIVKIPFGPGYTSMINTVDATTAWYGTEEPGFDSIYVWMSRPSTQFMNYSPYAQGTDRRMWNSIVELNLPAWAFTGDEEDPVPDEAFETYGYALFGKFTEPVDPAAVSNYSGMAMLINKFCGFGRGDVNDDGAINLVDIMYLKRFIGDGTPGPFPFMHLGDVDNSGTVDVADFVYMVDWYFYGGPNPAGDWALPQFVTP